MAFTAGVSMRFIPWVATGAGGLSLLAFGHWILGMIGLFLFVLGWEDLRQTQQAVRRNYPLTGRLRYALEYIRPEIRQYFLETDEEKIPFSRNQRALVYQRSKIQNDKRGFGSVKDMYAAGAEWIGHSVAPVHPDPEGFRIRVGGAACRQPYSMSVFNISAMSFGSLSANAILALNRGAKLGGFAHDTGEGSISKYHREHGGDLIWEIGSGYFGCRTADGRFDGEKFSQNARSNQVKMIEIKLSQGAKPGHGGVLPAAKVSVEISQTRGVPMGQDCVSPAAHSEFATPEELLAFIRRLRDLSDGKPVGMKLCIGQPWEWFAIAKAMVKTGIAPDFVVVDGAEGGTGAAPVEFSDHVGMPLRDGLRLVHNTLVGLGLREQIKIGASGKVVSAFDIARCLALGADWCNSARGFMFALGCIQSRHCHTDACPTGVATQDPSRQRALVVTDKAQRVSNFHRNTLANLADLLGAAGLSHPDQVTESHIMMRDGGGLAKPLASVIPHVDPGALSTAETDHIVLAGLPEPFKTYWPLARSDRFGI